MQKKTLVIIGGPTAVGKTDISIDLAKKFNTEILSCDSRQMYKELCIGTAVPQKEQLLAVKHHFIQCISIHDYYNAYMYEVAALDMLDKLFKKHNVVFMTGGSGLYVDGVLYGIDDLPTIDPLVRNELEERFHKEGIESLRVELKKVDPEYYDKVDLKNPKRILKALEVAIMSGKPYSTFLTKTRKERPFNTILIGLNRERSELHRRIEKRVDIMLENGLMDEAKGVFEYRGINSLNTVGYRELFDYFEGETTLDVAIELIKRNTRRYARRQITWLKRYNDLYWFEPGQQAEIEALILKNL